MPTYLTIDNNYSTLITDNTKLHDILWKTLRFRERGYFHSRLYKSHKWDGFRDFYSQKTGKFLTGLLPDIKKIIEMLGINYTITDKRDQFNFIFKSIDENFLKYGKDAIELYDYQVDAVNKILSNRRGIININTGAGKTNIMSAVIRCLPPKTPTLIVGNKKSLVEQNYDELNKWRIEGLGKLYDKENSPNYITCCTVQSVNKIEPLLSKIKVLIVDEIHEMMSETAVAMYKKLNNAVVRMAMSATPFKFEGNGGDDVHRCKVIGWIGSLIDVKSGENKLTTKILQDKNILSKSKCIFYIIDKPQLQYSIYQDAVTQGMAESQYFNKIVARLCQNITGRSLILVDRTSHGDLLQSLIPNSFWIQGKDNMETRKIVVEHLRTYKGNFVGISTHQILNTGINVKVHNLINCAGGSGSHMIEQRIGRGLRMSDDKDILNYYDFKFNINPYLDNHSEQRIKIIKKLGHEVEIKEIDFD